MMWVKEVGILFFLWGSAVHDWKKKEISLWAVIGLGIAGVCFSAGMRRELWDFTVSFGMGLMFVGLSLLTKGAIGMGDGWMLLALGTIMQAQEYLTMLSLSLLLAAFCGGILLVIYKKKNTEIPFVPFLLLGYVGGMFL